MANSGSSKGDNYRSFIYGEEEKNTKWKYGAPPNYDVVNKLFEEGRTKIWPPGSLEEKVQNLVKTWEMEMFHKVCFDEYKTVDPKKYRFSLNGRKGVTLEEKRKLGGGYNSLMQTSLLELFRSYNPAEETIDSSHMAFTKAFPCGFALEILQVYSGPPVIIYVKSRTVAPFRTVAFRTVAYTEQHVTFPFSNNIQVKAMGFKEGPFKGHNPTGEMVELYGMAVFELDENSKIVKVEFFFDHGELLGGLMKGCLSDSSTSG